MKLEIKVFYSYFHEKFPYRGKFLFEENLAHEFQLSLWAEGIEISPTTLFNYLLFQFKRQKFLYEGGKSRFKSGTYSLTIFREEAIKLFIKRNKEFDYQFEEDEVLKEYGIKKSELITVSGSKNFGLLQKRTKLTFFNTLRGFLNCLSSLVQPDEEDSICKKCIFLTECKATRNALK